MKYFALLFFVAAVSADIDPMCPYPSNVVTFFPNRADCTKFFECYQGQKSEYTCPLTTFWNQRAEACDYVCDFGDDTTPHPFPPEPTRDPMCPYPSDEIIFYPNRADCKKFFECYNGKRSEITCPSNTFWNQTAKACDYNCDFGDGTTPFPITTIVPPEPTRNPMCPYPSDEITFYPNRANCHYFFECYDGKRSEINCPSNLFWNQTAKACDYNCDFGDVTTISPFTDTTVPPGICKGQVTGTFLPDPTNCRRFVECVNQKPVVTTCPPGTYWNQSAVTCVGGDC